MPYIPSQVEDLALRGGSLEQGSNSGGNDSGRLRIDSAGSGYPDRDAANMVHPRIDVVGLEDVATKPIGNEGQIEETNLLDVNASTEQVRPARLPRLSHLIHEVKSGSVSADDAQYIAEILINEPDLPVEKVFGNGQFDRADRPNTELNQARSIFDGLKNAYMAKIKTPPEGEKYDRKTWVDYIRAKRLQFKADVEDRYDLLKQAHSEQYSTEFDFDELCSFVAGGLLRSELHLDNEGMRDIYAGVIRMAAGMEIQKIIREREDESANRAVSTIAG